MTCGNWQVTSDTSGVASRTLKNKAAFTPSWYVARGKWHVATGKPRGVPLENEHPETYENFHTEVAWHVACATCDVPRNSGIGFDRYFLMCDLPPRTVMPNFNGTFT
ncbi:hypothetical protein E2C01_084737 [Portunus trituberculatus]|uniref:Uncharacterized protein n=1 Tax=Portunus trituberculatus TaxID=210409 RepID=A0A5B7J8J3_PORTR|nr:hypothetical protein [Portunus trituberculatus]